VRNAGRANVDRGANRSAIAMRGVATTSPIRESIEESTGPAK
jgi:hypothetical protein